MNRLHKIDAELTALLEAIAKREEWTEGDIARRLRSTIDAWRSFKNGKGNAFMRARVRELVREYNGR
jgi:hypothetical protein